MDCRERVEGDRGIKLLKRLKLLPMSVSSTVSVDIWKRGREGGRRYTTKGKSPLDDATMTS